MQETGKCITYTGKQTKTSQQKNVPVEAQNWT